MRRCLEALRRFWGISLSFYVLFPVLFSVFFSFMFSAFSCIMFFVVFLVFTRFYVFRLITSNFMNLRHLWNYVLPIVSIYEFYLVWNYVFHLACTHIFFVCIYIVYICCIIHTPIYIIYTLQGLRLASQRENTSSPDWDF